MRWLVLVAAVVVAGGCKDAPLTDSDAHGANGATCGNGILEGDETCDGDCATCDDNNACTRDTSTGGSATCDLRCTRETIDACESGDGCCPAGCTHATDDDCSASCGDGIIDPNESCDPPGSCPTSCNDSNACTGDVLTVQVFENSSATSSADTGTRRTNHLAADLSHSGTSVGQTSIGVAGDFDGGGRTQRASRLLTILTVTVQEVLPGVFLFAQNGRKGFGWSHFVRRDAGNLVLDASRIGSFSDSFEEMDAMGGAAAVVISDRHLGGPPTNQIAERFGARVYCSRIEADAMGHRTNAVHIDEALPLERHVIEGDVLLGLASSGVHSNGFSLVRRIVAASGLAWDAPAPFAEDSTLAEALLEPTRIYVKSVLKAVRGTHGIKALAQGVVELYQKGQLTLSNLVKLLLTDTAATVLATIRDVCVGACNVISDLVGIAEDVLTRVINIPLLSGLYRLITEGSDPTVLDALALLLAIPATIFYKLLRGSAPFPGGKAPSFMVRYS